MADKSGSGETVRVQVTLTAETGQKVRELADRMNVSDSKMIQWLVDAAIEDQEWMIKLVTSRFAKAVAGVFGKKIPRSKKED